MQRAPRSGIYSSCSRRHLVVPECLSRSRIECLMQTYLPSLGCGAESANVPGAGIRTHPVDGYVMDALAVPRAASPRRAQREPFNGNHGIE